MVDLNSNNPVTPRNGVLDRLVPITFFAGSEPSRDPLHMTLRDLLKPPSEPGAGLCAYPMRDAAGSAPMVYGVAMPSGDVHDPAGRLRSLGVEAVVYTLLGDSGAWVICLTSRPYERGSTRANQLRDWLAEALGYNRSDFYPDDPYDVGTFADTGVDVHYGRPDADIQVVAVEGRPLDETVPAAPATPGARRGGFSLSALRDRPSRQWLLDELLPAGGLSLLVGQPGHGKTFAALDIALHVAAGKDAWDRRTRGGFVAYALLEGESDFATRAAAACEHHDFGDDIRFHAFLDPLRLMVAADVTALIADVREAAGGEPVALVVVDTLARATAGVDENSAGSMGAVIAGADRIRRELSCAVLLVHHCGKSGEIRGSSALPAAADAILHVARSAGGDVTVTTQKQKSGAAAEPIKLSLMPVGGSLVVAGVAAGAPALSTKASAGRGRQGGAARPSPAAKSLPAAHPSPAARRLPPSVAKVYAVLAEAGSLSREEWRQAALQRGAIQGAYDGASWQAREKVDGAFRGRLHSLLAAGAVVQDGDLFLPVPGFE